MRDGRTERDDWDWEPMPAKSARLALTRTFTPQESDRVRAGVTPEDMDDKWFVFLERDRLYFHRAWTGHCFFEASVEEHDGVLTIVEVRANRDPAQVGRGGTQASSTALLNRVIDRVLLDR